MAASGPDRKFSITVVPKEGGGRAHHFELSLAQLRKLAMAGAAVVALAVLGLGLLLTAVPRSLAYRATLDENVAIKAHLQDMERSLDEVDDVLRRLRLYDAQVNTLPGAGLPGLSEPDELLRRSLEAQQGDEADTGGAGGHEADPADPNAGAEGAGSDAGDGASDDGLGRGGPELDPAQMESGVLDIPAGLSPGEQWALRVSDRLNRTLSALRVALPAAGALAEAAEDVLSRKSSMPSIWPVEGILTSRFGYRRSPFNHRWRLHLGLDLAADRGTWVLAPAAGVVVRAEYAGGYGRLLEIDHGNGVHTRLAHNSTLHVGVGDVVIAGQPVAVVGSTGWSTGPHCHFEILIDGDQVDPLLLMPPRLPG